MADYVEAEKKMNIPPLPLEGLIDFTYRCNNNCRHCWLRIPPTSKEKQHELTTEGIKSIVKEARKMGCRKWQISGGEPMLRPDFPALFDFITSKSISYSLNTNGTLITPEIARLMKRKGSKMIALYGATSKVHDHITRNPGSFNAAMQGITYLKEAGAGFTVQIIPMKDNYHQLHEMIDLAKSLSPLYRFGASWFYLSASGDAQKNLEITEQRLPPENVLNLDMPDVSFEEDQEGSEGLTCRHTQGDEFLFASCLHGRQNFHIDPYGGMSFCCFIKDPALRYDLRKGNFRSGWDKYIPSLIDKVKADKEYRENCGSCDLRDDCRWCPAFGYLEHGRFSAKIDYLCAAAKDKRRYKKEWKERHRRYYTIGGITLKVESELPFSETTFLPKFRLFEVDKPGNDVVSLKHFFFIPDIQVESLGKEVYRKAPWAIYKRGNSWIYANISNSKEDKSFYRVAVFNREHNRARIYHPDGKIFRQGNLRSLTLFPTDQILIARLLADREGCYLHSSAIILDGKGFVFVGHSEAGKSTIASLFKEKAEILCDDRNILRRHADGFWVYGTWSGSDELNISPNSAPLKAIFFLKKSQANRIDLLKNKQEIMGALFSCLIRPFMDADWWDKIFDLVEILVNEIPCYNLNFDKSSKIVNLIERL